MDFKKFCENVFEYAMSVGFSDCEIYYIKGDSLSVKIFNKDLNQFSNSNLQGLSFRGLYKGKMGYSFTEKIDNDVISELVENAKINAELIEHNDIEEIYAGDKFYEDVNNFSLKLQEVSAEDKIKLAKDIEEYTYSLSDKIYQVSNCYVNTSESELFIVNTKGLNLSHKMNIAYVVIGVIVKDGDSTKQWYDYWYGNDIENLDYKALCEKTVEDALKRTNANSLKSGKYDIILTKDAMINLLGAYCNIFNAKAVQDNLSLLKGKIGETIASPKVTIIDDGMESGGKVQVPFDSEGYRTEKTVLIENGVLKGFLHSSKTALKDGVKSTGNGFKSSYKSSVSVQPTNFYLKSGETSFSDLKKILNKGIIIDDLSGLHAGVNAVSGELSLLASGFLVENGEIVRPVEQITISSNFYDLIKNVEEIADDIKFEISGNGTIASPSILVRNLDIAGGQND